MQAVSPSLLILQRLPLHHQARLRCQSSLMKLDYLLLSNPGSGRQSANAVPPIPCPILLPFLSGHLRVKARKAIRTGSRGSTKQIMTAIFVKISGAEFSSISRSS